MNTKKISTGKLNKHSIIVSLILVAWLVIGPFHGLLLQAQEIKNEAQLSPGNLKAFEGFYQFQNNKDAFLQITARGNNLVLKQLWDEKEFVFEQDSALYFYCKAQSFPLKFKESGGSIVQVLAFNRDVWDKVKDYKPVIKKEVQLTPQQLKACEGKYQLKRGDDNAFLQITAKGNNLILKQLWDGQEIAFVPESALEFYCKARMFPLKFMEDKDGAINQVLAFNRDLWIKVKD